MRQQNELISEFKSKYPQHKIAISLNRSSTNIFEFHSTEVAFNAFIGIAKDYIMRERNREIDLFEVFSLQFPLPLSIPID